MHRDLKPENLLLDNGRVIIADFGCASYITNNKNTYCGTPDYVAPEVILGHEQDEKVDIWGLGILLFEILTGISPFSPKTNNLNRYEYITQLKENILKGNVLDINLLNHKTKDLFLWLTAKDPRMRPNIRQVFSHSWINNKVYDNKARKC